MAVSRCVRLDSAGVPGRPGRIYTRIRLLSPTVRRDRWRFPPLPLPHPSPPLLFPQRGHRHRQSITYDDMSTLGPTAVLVTGGGGGITSEGEPDAGGEDDQYGFVDLSLTRDEIRVAPAWRGRVGHRVRGRWFCFRPSACIMFSLFGAAACKPQDYVARLPTNNMAEVCGQTDLIRTWCMTRWMGVHTKGAGGPSLERYIGGRQGFRRSQDSCTCPRWRSCDHRARPYAGLGRST